MIYCNNNIILSDKVFTRVGVLSSGKMLEGRKNVGKKKTPKKLGFCQSQLRKNMKIKTKLQIESLK